jgi:hypothetical protein
MNNRNTALALTIVFAIIAFTAITVFYANDRLVVKITMFAIGTAFGASPVSFIIQRRTAPTNAS